MTSAGNAVVPVPPIVLDDPLKVTVFAPPLRLPVPFVVQFPANVMLPASVTVTPVFIWKLPNVIAAVGVIVPLPVKATFEVASNVSAVVLTVRLPPKLKLLPAKVVKTAAV